MLQASWPTPRAWAWTRSSRPTTPQSSRGRSRSKRQWSAGRPDAWWRLAGFRCVSWQTVALILAINTGYAAILWIEDHRTFWHPFITAQCFGLAIAYMVNAARPWEQSRPLWRLLAAVGIGTAALADPRLPERIVRDLERTHG